MLGQSSALGGISLNEQGVFGSSVDPCDVGKNTDTIGALEEENGQPTDKGGGWRREYVY